VIQFGLKVEATEMLTDGQVRHVVAAAIAALFLGGGLETASERAFCY
jgi:hypothetical protein